jgi:hypothetical protein
MNAIIANVKNPTKDKLLKKNIITNNPPLTESQLLKTLFFKFFVLKKQNLQTFLSQRLGF